MRRYHIAKSFCKEFTAKWKSNCINVIDLKTKSKFLYKLWKINGCMLNNSIRCYSIKLMFSLTMSLRKLVIILLTAWFMRIFYIHFFLVLTSIIFVHFSEPVTCFHLIGPINYDLVSLVSVRDLMICIFHTSFIVRYVLYFTLVMVFLCHIIYNILKILVSSLTFMLVQDEK